MKKYFLLLTLLPLSANGALRVFSLKNLRNITQILSQQRTFVSRPSAQYTPVEYHSPQESLKEIVLQELDRQGIALTDINPNAEEALNCCIVDLINTAYEYKQTGWVGAYHGLQVSNTTLEATVEYLNLLEK